jgi:hypothetical protein
MIVFFISFYCPNRVLGVLVPKVVWQKDPQIFLQKNIFILFFLNFQKFGEQILKSSVLIKDLQRKKVSGLFPKL